MTVPSKCLSVLGEQHLPQFAAALLLLLPPFAEQDWAVLHCDRAGLLCTACHTPQGTAAALSPAGLMEVNLTENQRVCPDIAPCLCSQPGAEQRKIASTLTVEEFSEAVLEGTKSVVLLILWKRQLQSRCRDCDNQNH